MKTTILIAIYSVLQKIESWIAAHDKGYQTYRNWHYNVMPYAEYLKAERKWKALETKYGSWSEAWEHEPHECSRLELLLA